MVYIPSQIYTFRRPFVSPTAKTLLQIKANATRPIVVLAFGLEPIASGATSQTIACQLGRIPTTFGTVTIAAAGDIAPHNPNFATTGVQLGTSATGYNATVEPTYTDTWFQGGNALASTDDIALPEMRMVFNAATGVGLFLPVAPPANTYEAWITYAEV